jgi:hypothetical protein
MRATVRFFACVRAHVGAQVSRYRESLLADATFIRLLAEVNGTLVPPETRTVLELHRTRATGVRLLAGMCSRVYLQTSERTECHRAVRTRVRTNAGVDAGVDRQKRSMLETSPAVGAHVRRRVRVRALVIRARAVLRKTLSAVANAAHVRSLARVCPEVGVKGRLSPETATAFVAHELSGPCDGRRRTVSAAAGSCGGEAQASGR